MEVKQVAIRKRLIPLMFEMGRLLKSEVVRDGFPVPSFLHVETLRFIHDEGTPGMSDVADYLKITPPSATALVNTFVKDGVIKRVSDPDDRRRVRLMLSAKGQKLFDEITHKRSQAFSRVFASLSEKDCSELARILAIIIQSNDSFSNS